MAQCIMRGIIKHTNIVEKVLRLAHQGDGHSNKISIHYVDSKSYKYISDINNRGFERRKH